MQCIKISGFNCFSFYCEDIASSLTFYTEVLGMEKCRDMGPGVLLKAGGEKNSLTIYLEGGRKSRPSAGSSFACSPPCFDVAGGIRAAFEKLKEAGVPIVEEYRTLNESLVFFSVADPSGNIIEFAGHP